MIRSSLESKLYVALGLKFALPSESDTTRSRLSRPLAIAVSGCLLLVVLIAYRTRGASFRWGLFLATVAQVDWRWLTASICLILLTNIVRALRWQVMLRPMEGRFASRPVGLWQLTSDTAIGLTAGVLLGRVGEVVRPYLIAVQTGLPFSSQAAAWMLERVLDLLAILLLCGFALVKKPFRFGPAGYVLFFLAILCLVVLVALGDPSRRAHRRILAAVAFLPEHQQHRIARLLENSSGSLECTRRPGLLAQLLSYTALGWALIVGGSYALFHGFVATHSFSPIDVLVMLALMTLGSAVQIPGVGGGAQVAAVFGLTSIYHLPLEAASGIAVLLWIVSSIAIVPIGLICAFHEGLNWRKLKLLSTKQILEDPEP